MNSTDTIFIRLLNATDNKLAELPPYHQYAISSVLHDIANMLALGASEHAWQTIENTAVRACTVLAAPDPRQPPLPLGIEKGPMQAYRRPLTGGFCSVHGDYAGAVCPQCQHKLRDAIKGGLVCDGD